LTGERVIFIFIIVSETPRHNKQEPIVENKNTLAYPTRTMDPPMQLVDRAREIEAAEGALKVQADGKLELILRQIRSLQQEARAIIEQAHQDVELHRVKCNFEKQIGEEIFLYEKPGGGLYFSRLSPSDWNDNPPHDFRGGYRLQADRSFENTLPAPTNAAEPE
jgi:hypothetical protein